MIKKALPIAILVLASFLFYNFLMSHSTPTEFVSAYVSSSSNLYANFNNQFGESVNDKERRVEEIVNKYLTGTKATLGIGIKNLTTGQEYYLNKDMPFTAASLYKLMVMYSAFYEAKLGRLNIDDPVIAGSLKAMISVSSNEDALFLADKIGWSRITEISRKIGLKNTSFNPPTTTPEDVTNLLNLIVQERALDPSSSIQMKDLLLSQKINDRIPALLPPIPVAHKTGELDDVRHDAGIVYGDKSTYIITLMSKGITSEEEIKSLMAQLSLDIYNLFEN